MSQRTYLIRATKLGRRPIEMSCTGDTPPINVEIQDAFQIDDSWEITISENITNNLEDLIIKMAAELSPRIMYRDSNTPFPATCFIYRDNNRTEVPLPENFNKASMQERFRHGLLKINADFGLDAYLVACEGLYIKETFHILEVIGGARIVDHPARQSCFFIIACNRNRSSFKIWDLVYQDGKISDMIEQENKGIQGKGRIFDILINQCGLRRGRR